MNQYSNGMNRHASGIINEHASGIVMQAVRNMQAVLYEFHNNAQEYKGQRSEVTKNETAQPRVRVHELS